MSARTMEEARSQTKGPARTQALWLESRVLTVQQAVAMILQVGEENDAGPSNDYLTDHIYSEGDWSFDKF